MLALVICGFGLSLGLSSGHAPIGVTLIPAIFGAAVIAVVLLLAWADARAERALERRADRATGRLQRWLRRAAAVPRSLRSGLREAVTVVRTG
jgi:hypothetical protein